MSKKIVETPLMKQYAEMKQKHPDAVLLFRVGDFYETFSDDAITASEILGITLTRRANGAASYVELAGFPHHALDTYLPRLVRAGKRVAICEQLEDPKLTKKLVKRGITELVTPGVVLNDNVLDHRSNNFLAALHQGGRDRWGVAFLDISTGEFLTAEGSADYIDKLLGSYAPKEVLVLRGTRNTIEQTFSGKYLCFELDDWVYTYDAAVERLLAQFHTATLKGFGIDRMPSATIACGAALRYLDITNHKQTGHITAVSTIDEQRYVRLDNFTRRNLELVQPLSDEGMTLYSVLNRTVTPMGARMLHNWIVMPLRDPAAINRRLDVIEYFFKNPDLRDDLDEIMAQIGDLGRLTGKVASMRALPRDIVGVRNAMMALASVKARCQASECPELVKMGKRMDACRDMVQRISDTVIDDTPNKIGSGKTIREGVNAELDELRQIAGSGKQYLERIREREIEATGIPSLKINYNNVFGYYIEVTNTHRDKVPAEWIRKQTLVNAERYITLELKEYEEKILGAEGRIDLIENNIYNDLLAYMQQFVTAMQADAHLVATLDCLLSLCHVAVDNRYVRPVVDDSLVIDLREARHPVIERRLPPGEPYIANSVKLSNEGQQIMMITGPNMSGKSALLRQTALNVLMAQMGSFVAAESATVGVVDKIFTRVGASDNISLGESTFMVEMTEAATIINSMTERSLILFDELGRGTSTYDGISIAWAIVEHIHNGNKHPKTLFATHYHELNDMAATYPRIANYHVSVSEMDGRIVFLRKLEPGGSEHSFGIHVARLAGMPKAIVERADKVLVHLENERRDADRPALAPPPKETDGGAQLSFFQLDDPVLCQLRDALLNLDINSLTPLAALNKLQEMQSILSGR